VVVVTGGSGGLGSALSTRFAAGGDTVFVGYHNGEERLQAVLDAIERDGGTAFPLHVDLASPSSVEEAFASVVERAGPVDVLINNAAYRPIGPFLELSEEEWQAVLGVNLMGAVRCCRAVLPGMVEKRKGRIINISGLDALWGWGNRAHVTVSKAGLSGLSRAVAVEFSEHGITANTLVLGSFRVARDPAIYPQWERMRQFLVNRAVTGRQGEPSELADWCWFIASDAGDWFTGQDVHLNGGTFPIERNPLLHEE
jgi:NAD(P)-dependent dehydrogenase (short-subunit alcohol dehydrogenase family)